MAESNDGNDDNADLLRLLNDRLLIMTNDRSAIDLLPYVDVRTGGLVLTGADAPSRCRHLRNRFPDVVVAVDLAGHEHSVATPTHPFGYRSKDGGWHALGLAGVEEILNGQLANKAAFAVTPTAFIREDEAGDARVLKAVIGQANRLRRTDTVVLLPCSWRWLRDGSLSHLVEQVRASRHPVALIMQHSDDPLRARGVIEGLRLLCRSCPGLLLWRTDLAVFDALAHGAIGGAVGMTAALRHGLVPRVRSGGPPGSPHPVVLVRELLEYRRVAKLRDWTAVIGPWPCDCRVCEGRSLDRFDNSPAAVPETRRHTLCELFALHAELTSTHAGWERLMWWRQMVADAIERHHHLCERLGETTPSHPRTLHKWQEPSPPPLASS
ncbi:hypothetical protein ACYF6T_07970 [Streptomyces sp. 7R007]